MKIIRPTKALAAALGLAIFALAGTAGLADAQARFRGLRVEAERRCSPYDKRADYRHDSRRLEPQIVRRLNDSVYGPYTGRCFDSPKRTDVEHIVATSEAHDSGMCGRSKADRRRFANDLLNLTLAGPDINRLSKKGLDAGQWLPPKNRCWFAGRVVAVKRKWDLSVDRREAAALERVLQACDNRNMERFRCDGTNTTGAGEANDSLSAAPRRRQGGTSTLRTGQSSMTSSKPSPVLRFYDRNRDGRITCDEVRRAGGPLPVPSKHPAYAYMSDGDNDGVVCEGQSL